MESLTFLNSLEPLPSQHPHHINPSLIHPTNFFPLFSQLNFRFIEKQNRMCRKFPCTTCLHTWIISLTTDSHQVVHLLQQMNLHRYNASHHLHQGSLLVLYIVWIRQKCNDVSSPLECHTGQIPCLKNPLSSAYTFLSLSYTLVATDLFTVSIVLSFPECQHSWSHALCSLSSSASFTK